MAIVFKIQTPLVSSSRKVEVLIYNQEKTVFEVVTGEHAKTIVEGLGMEPAGDKVYVEAVLRDGYFIANLDTITREDQGW